MFVLKTICPAVLVLVDMLLMRGKDIVYNPRAVQVRNAYELLSLSSCSIKSLNKKIGPYQLKLRLSLFISTEQGPCTLSPYKGSCTDHVLRYLYKQPVKSVKMLI